MVRTSYFALGWWCLLFIRPTR